MTAPQTSLGIIASVSLLMASCANVKFYSDEELTEKTGIKFYPAAPFLLVKFTKSDGSEVSTEVISLPDLENPVFADYKAGWGTHEFALKMSNGVLTEYSQVTDSKGPETLDAVANLASLAAGAYKSIAEAKKTSAETDLLRKQSGEVSEAVTRLTSAAADLSRIIDNPSLAPLDSVKPNVSSQQVAIEEIIETLENTSGPISTEAAKAAIKEIETVNTALIALAESQDQGTDLASAIREPINAASTHLSGAIKALKAAGSIQPPPAKPAFELYQIHFTDGRVFLRPVVITGELSTYLGKVGTLK